MRRWATLCVLVVIGALCARATTTSATSSSTSTTVSSTTTSTSTPTRNGRTTAGATDPPTIPVVTQPANRCPRATVPPNSQSGGFVSFSFALNYSAVSCTALRATIDSVWASSNHTVAILDYVLGSVVVQTYIDTSRGLPNIQERIAAVAVALADNTTALWQTAQDGSLTTVFATPNIDMGLILGVTFGTTAVTCLLLLIPWFVTSQ